jgi:hypothetical protein
MAFNKTPPLDERIRQIRAEIDAIIDEKVEQSRKECPGVPPGVLRDLITAQGGGCQCRQYLQIMEGDEA